MVVTIVGRKNDQRVVVQSLLLQLIQNSPASRIDLGGQTVVILHHRLVFFRCIETPMPTIASLVFFVAHEIWQTLKGCLRCVLGDGDRDVLIQFHALGLRQELLRMRVLGMSGKEGDCQTEWLICRTCAQKL